MDLLETRIERKGDEARLVGVIRERGAEPTELYVSVHVAHAHLLDDRPDPFVPALLVPCLKTGENLRIASPVSPRLLHQLWKAQDVLISWYPAFRRSTVEASVRASDAPRGSGTVALFSGGVDSFYTLLRASRSPRGDVPRPTHLLFIRGHEQELGNLQGVEDSIRQFEEIARENGQTAVVAETNLRGRFAVNYLYQYFGAALSAAALALARGIGTLLLPASFSYAHLAPNGSHALLDPLWSTERMEIIHHGAEARRVDKVSALSSEWPASLARLRVCSQNAGGGYNCGRCGKCLRTMTALDLLGALAGAGSFPSRLPAHAAAVLGEEGEAFLEELQELGHRVAPESATARLVDRVLARRRRRAAVRKFCENTPLLAGVFQKADRLRRRAGHRT